ncbi:MAG TPA: prepilin peptidase [Gemmatimonadaceae bacterium]|nr:prepilin peptidase [Gemmatimonadaceae bacterium]
MTETTARIFAFVLGAVVGSFLNVCVSRWPQDQSVISPPSRCPGCGRPIRWHENVPILGWLRLRGRCAGCREPISAMYPLVELVVGLIWLAAVLHYGPTFTALRVAIVATVLLGIALTDAMHYVIPDGFTVFGFIWGVAAAFIGAALNETLPFAGLYDSLIGACVGAGAIAIAGWLGEVALKKEAMGFGDVTLMAVVGAALGPQRSLLTVFLGAALGAVSFLLLVYPIAWFQSRRKREAVDLPLVPFGVFLAPAAMIALFFGQAMIDWYRQDIMGL